MVLVETSVWVMAEHGRVDISRLVPDDDIAICPPIMLEVLRGVTSQRYRMIHRMLSRAVMLDAPVPLDRFESAAKLFMVGRDIGITIRSSINCLIAATAIAHNVQLLHDDRDFEHMKRIVPLRTITL